MKQSKLVYSSLLFLNLWPAHAWFLEIDLVCEVCVCVHVFVCLLPRLLITSGICDMNNMIG